ncbi:hypothetical protein ARMGADRAFT_1026386 [Armillaria gallica]|uniref:Uncharacterized protein n=1 Tax=Armillaria gallica TaxID=47427 RepID=A0A2H3DWC7_ARMGA|nr:hypothetical protein ARMGADRAFT_1026386 [Armillaria gallica]
MNQHPPLPETCDENTTDRNPFRRSTRGTYGLRQTHGTGRMLGQNQTPTSHPSSTGWTRTFPHSSDSGTYLPRLSKPQPLNYPTPLWSEIPYPPMREGTRGRFPGRVQDHYGQRSAIASPSPRRHDTADLLGRLASQSQRLNDSEGGHRRIPTPTPTPMSLDPLSDEDDFQTPRVSPVPSPTKDYQTRAPSTRGGATTSGTSSNRSTGTSSVPTRSRPGNSGEQTWRRAPEFPSGTPPGNTWNTSSPYTKGIHSILDNRPTWKSSPVSTPTATAAYTLHILGWNEETSVPAPKSNKKSLSGNSPDSDSSMTNNDRTMDPLTGLRGFQYDWDSIEPGFQPAEDAETPHRTPKDPGTTQAPGRAN